MVRRAPIFLVALWLSLSVPEARARANDASYRFDAIAAFDDGRYEDALSALARGPITSDLAYLRVRVLAELGRYAEALDVSEPPSPEWPAAVVRDLRELRVGWTANAGRCNTLEAQGKGGASRASERLAARCAFAAEQYQHVKELLGSAKDAEGRSLYIRALIALSERELARPLARAFYVEYPGHRDAEHMRTFLEGEGGPITFTVEELLTRAEGFLAARQPEVAFDELKSLHSLKDPKLEARLWHLRGEALFRTRKRYPEAVKAFAHAAKLRGETEDYDAFHSVRAESRAGDDRRAIVGYKAFAKRYKKSKLAPDAMYLAAWLSARENLPHARADLKSFIDSKYGAQAPSLRRDAIWELAFYAVQQHLTRDAVKWLDEYARAVDRPLERARAAYWRGRTALITGDRAGARAQFARALREDRLGYYAQLAARRLVALGEPSPPAFEATPGALARPTLRALPEEVTFYRRLGLYADAGDAANRFLGQEADRVRRVAALLESGDANRIFAAAEPLFDRALEGPPTPERSWIWQALLPRPYARTVYEQCQRQRLDPSLFYGHMQVESHYKAKAVSGADALGLLQLLPETAASVAEGLGIEVERADLTRPYLNITLGAAYLSGLVQRYHGQYPLAIAAYNAGTHKVDEWLAHEGEHGSELDAWVESIPVEQTRNYVRRVITAWSRYHALLAPDQPWALPLPEKVSLHAD